MGFVRLRGCPYAPSIPTSSIHLDAPQTSVCPCTPPYICMFLGASAYDMGMGASVHPMFGVWGHQHICQAFWCLSVHPLSLSLWVASYWTGYFWMSVTLHAVVPFFVVSLCLKPPLPQLWLLFLWWLWCLVVCHLYYWLPWLPPWWGFQQHWVSMMWVLPPLLTPRSTEGVVGIVTVPQPPSISDASSGLCQLCHGSTTGRFLFSELSLPLFFIYYVWCLF